MEVETPGGMIRRMCPLLQSGGYSLRLYVNEGTYYGTYHEVKLHPVEKVMDGQTARGRFGGILLDIAKSGCLNCSNSNLNHQGGTNMDERTLRCEYPIVAPDSIDLSMELHTKS